MVLLIVLHVESGVDQRSRVVSLPWLKQEGGQAKEKKQGEVGEAQVSKGGVGKEGGAVRLQVSKQANRAKLKNAIKLLI